MEHNMADYGLRGAYFPDDYWTDGSHSYWPICIILAYVMTAATFVDQAVTTAIDRIADVSTVARAAGTALSARLARTFMDRVTGSGIVAQVADATRPDRLVQAFVDEVADASIEAQVTETSQSDQLVQTSVKRLGQ